MTGPTATDAPKPPAPQSPPTLTTLPSDKVQGETGPKLTAVEIATRDARARVERGEPMVAPDAAARDPKSGQFTTEKSDVVREVGTPRADAAPPAGQAAPGVEKKPGEGEAAEDTDAVTAPPGDASTATGGEVEETDKEPGAEAENVDGDDPLTVMLPGRNKGEEFPIKVDSEETAERLRQLRNSGMRGEEIKIARDEMAQREERMADTISSIELDPTGYLLAIAGEQPEIELEGGKTVNLVDHMVLHLLTQPKVFERLSPRIAALLDDEKELRTVRAETNSDRQDIRNEMTREADTRRVVSKNLQDVQATVGSLLPVKMPEEQQQLLYADCLRDLKGYADRNRLVTIPVNDIPTILANRLTAYGINPVEAAARIAESAVRRGNAAARRPAAPGTSTRAPAPVRTPAPKSGKDHVASATRKQAAAAVPPAGAGSPTGTGALTAPTKADGSKMGVEETVKWHREQIRKGIKRI